MILHFLLKPLLIFIAGVVFAVAVFGFLKSPWLTRVLGAQSSNVASHIENRINEDKKQVIASSNTNGSSIVGQVLSLVEESPVFAPFFRTKRDVETATESIMSLPQEQRSALCRQICQ